MLTRFDGQVAIVTGAGSGIGRATAIKFAAEGARVIAADISRESLDELAGKASGNVEVVAGDLIDPAVVDVLMNRAGGRVDVLANVAGIMDGFMAAGDVDDATWDQVLAVNLTAPLRLMRAVLPVMLQAKRGAIVNVASEAGVKGGCAGAAYTASKHGLVGLTKNTAFLYASSGIRVNAVAPGPVETGLRPEFRSTVAAERLPALMKASITRLASPNEIADTIVWLSGSESTNVNGAVLMVDGGWSAA